MKEGVVGVVSIKHFQAILIGFFMYIKSIHPNRLNRHINSKEREEKKITKIVFQKKKIGILVVYVPFL